MAVVETGSLLSFSITSLAGFLDNSISLLGIVHFTRMGSLAGFLDNSQSLLGIAAGLGLASPSSDKKMISVLGSFVGYLLEKSA